MSTVAPLAFEVKVAAAPKLRFLSLSGGEELSRPFEYRLVGLLKATEPLAFDDVLGAAAEVTVGVGNPEARVYHGVVAAVAFDGTRGGYLSYRFTLRPWLWLLTRSVQLRIFQKKSVPDILKAVFNQHGGIFDDQTTATYRKREYCVQYRESDFNFVSRLMEEEGIFYFFKHVAGKHTLVMADAPSVHVAMLGLSTLTYFDDSNPDHRVPAVSKWRWSREVRSGKAALRDHSFLLPDQNFEKLETAQVGHAQGAHEVYDHPAGLQTYPDDAAVLSGLPDEAGLIAKRRIEELRSRFAVAQGETSVINLCTGARMTLQQHPVVAQNAEYLVYSTQTEAAVSGYEGGQTTATSHRCSFSVFDARLAFRPERSTPRPRAGGPQTATVVGPAGKEIHIDKHGRVKVQFHWDRQGTSDANSSCFVRVSQPSAGKGWGMVFLPRIGQEVVVDFLDGDPDQPLVTGGVYNADNMPPYTLPDNATVSTIKSRSTEQGGATDFNELRFEDLKGSEYLLMQSQKDKLEFVKETVKTEVGKDQHLIIKQDRKEKVEGDFHLTVVKALKQKVDGKYSLKVAQDILLATDANHGLKAAQGISSEAGTTISLKAGTEVHIKAGTNAGFEGGVNVHIKGAANVVIEAGAQLTLKGGAGSVVLGPDGVSITGPMVKINSGGAPGSGSGISPVAPSAPEAPADPEPPEDPLSHT